jgi:PadR family transcriptional regulator PadR
MPTQPRDTLNGALDLLILKTLTQEPMHGWGIGQRIQETSRGVLDVNQGSLYPALQRLERAKLIASSWGTTDNHRQARYYRITAAGRRALGADMETWRRISAAVELVLQGT